MLCIKDLKVGKLYKYVGLETTWHGDRYPIYNEYNEVGILHVNDIILCLKEPTCCNHSYSCTILYKDIVGNINWTDSWMTGDCWQEF
jgi:hypothetical protein